MYNQVSSGLGTLYSVQYVEKWVVRQPTRTGLVYVECKLAGVEIRYKKLF